MTNDNPIDILFDPDGDTPENILVKHGSEMDADEFIDSLTAIGEASEKLVTFQEEVEEILDSGLDREDVVNLIWARTALTKTAIQDILDTVEYVDKEAERDKLHLLTRLTADLSDQGINTTRATFDELQSLHEKYGDNE